MAIKKETKIRLIAGTIIVVISVLGFGWFIWDSTKEIERNMFGTNGDTEYHADSPYPEIAWINTFGPAEESIMHDEMCIFLPDDVTPIGMTNNGDVNGKYMLWVEGIKDCDDFMKNAFRCSYEKGDDNLKPQGDQKYDGTTDTAVCNYTVSAYNDKKAKPFNYYFVFFYDDGNGGYKAKIFGAIPYYSDPD